jgi:hypothetical protein
MTLEGAPSDPGTAGLEVTVPAELGRRGPEVEIGKRMGSSDDWKDANAFGPKRCSVQTRTWFRGPPPARYSLAAAC